LSVSAVAVIAGHRTSSREDEFCGFSGCALVLFNGKDRIPRDRIAARGVMQEVFYSTEELPFIGNLYGSIHPEELIHHCLEVFHVQSENYWFPGERRFNGVLSSNPGEAFAHKDHGCEGVPVSEFTGGVHNDDIRLVRKVSLPEFAPEPDAKP
jgi:hypothetical protein